MKEQRSWRGLVQCCVLALAAGGCAPSLNLTNPVSESHEWFGQGLPNLIRVSDCLYRGGQPSREGLKRLKKMGIKTVVNLRSSRGVKDREAEECRDLGMHYEQLRMPAFDDVPAGVVKRFFELVEDRERTPIFVHCLTGTDRVSVLMALYRIRYEHWTGDKAYDDGPLIEELHEQWGIRAVFRADAARDEGAKTAVQRTHGV